MPRRPCERLGRTAKLTIVRGGTDGSRLTELGLPTPNLSCGGHNPHSPLEWACLEEMVESVEWLVALAEVWARTRTWRGLFVNCGVGRANRFHGGASVACPTARMPLRLLTV